MRIPKAVRALFIALVCVSIVAEESAAAAADSLDGKSVYPLNVSPGTVIWRYETGGLLPHRVEWRCLHWLA